MSADSQTVCPRCALEKGIDLSMYGGPEKSSLLVPKGVIDHAAEEHGLDRSVRENVDYYIRAVNGRLELHFEYRADCWDCGWHHEAELVDPIPGVKD